LTPLSILICTISVETSKSVTLLLNEYSKGDKSANESYIRMLDADGKSLKEMSNFPGLDSRAEVSPDGMRIAFSSNRTGRFALYLMNIDGSDQHRLTNYQRDETSLTGRPMENVSLFPAGWKKILLISF